MGNLTGRIKQEENGKGLWLLVDDLGGQRAENLIDELTQPREKGNVAWAVLPEEIEAIRDACNDYLRDKEVDSIDIVWCVDDVFNVMYDYEEKDTYSEEDYEIARAVLQYVKNHHDATIGVNWETLEYALDQVRG
jgi:hypothetical protein